MSTSKTSADGLAPRSSDEVVSLARQAVKSNNETADPGRTGVTIDLSRQRIRALPVEAIDIIKDNLER